MALDVYAGPLTRYYAGNWKNTVQQWSEQMGMNYRVVRAGGPSGEEKASHEEAREAVLRWRRRLSEALAPRIHAPLDWVEDAAADYYTERPGWDPFFALLLWAAYEEHPEIRRPADFPEEPSEDAALKSSRDCDSRSRYGQIVSKNLDLWLPGDGAFTFKAGDVCGNEVVMGFGLELVRQLEDLNRRTWKAGVSDIDAWAAADHTTGLEGQARTGFFWFYKCARWAATRRLPLKLDY